MTDIGVPKRIVHWIYENREIINLELTNEEFKNDLIELKNICGNYEKGPNTLKTTISKIDEWLEII